jgi:hypothetical protein
MLSGKFHGTDHAERLPEGHVHAPRDGDRVAVVLVDRSGVEVEDLPDHRDLAAGARDRLAHVLRLDSRQLLRVLLDQAREPAQQPRPIRGCDGAPRRIRSACARDRRVGVLDAGLRQLRDRLFSRGVDDGLGHADDSTQWPPAALASWFSVHKL